MQKNELFRQHNEIITHSISNNNFFAQNNEITKSIYWLNQSSS